MLWSSLASALLAQLLLPLTDALIPPPTSVTYELAKPTHLDVRQNTEDAESTTLKITITNAPDATCGYISTSTGSSNAITCPDRAVCQWEKEYYGLIFCGVENMLTRCIAGDEALDPSLCDEECKNNWSNLLCTNETLPFCSTWGFPSGIRAFQCGSVSSLVKASFTYYGQTDREFSTLVLSDEEPTATATGASGNVGAETSAEPNSDGGTSTNTGAIVGGVVGGLAVVTLLVLGVLFLRRRPQREHVPATSDPSSNRFAQDNMEPPTEEVPLGVSPQSKHLSHSSFPIRPELHGSPEFQADGVSHGNSPRDAFILPELPASIHEFAGDDRFGPQQV
ncbi:hypothetical protein G7Z17_g2396 [Cylindrodendrum hubeiense]|uniref:Uncharacterized protein n=1 Tax=Cylindrodendrum hubeiense TaxID=595255 RepID=A0A9P5LL43_9HYPO|nr:hypothetical protein G7Z17_g2396 [Cylindrodendrum hubeiense]